MADWRGQITRRQLVKRSGGTARVAATQVPADTSIDVSDAPNASTQTHLGVADRRDEANQRW
jgi:hypothetical protein